MWYAFFIASMIQTLKICAKVELIWICGSSCTLDRSWTCRWTCQSWYRPLTEKSKSSCNLSRCHARSRQNSRCRFCETYDRTAVSARRWLLLSSTWNLFCLLCILWRCWDFWSCGATPLVATWWTYTLQHGLGSSWREGSFHTYYCQGKGLVETRIPSRGPWSAPRGSL